MKGMLHEVKTQKSKTPAEQIERWIKQNDPETHAEVREMIEAQNYADYNALMKEYERSERILPFRFAYKTSWNGNTL